METTASVAGFGSAHLRSPIVLVRTHYSNNSDQTIPNLPRAANGSEAACVHDGAHGGAALVRRLRLMVGRLVLLVRARPMMARWFVLMVGRLVGWVVYQLNFVCAVCVTSSCIDLCLYAGCGCDRQASCGRKKI